MAESSLFAKKNDGEKSAGALSFACSQASSCSQESVPCSNGGYPSWWPEPETKVFLNEPVHLGPVAGQKDWPHPLMHILVVLKKGACSSSLFVAIAF